MKHHLPLLAVAALLFAAIDSIAASTSGTGSDTASPWAGSELTPVGAEMPQYPLKARNLGITSGVVRMALEIGPNVKFVIIW